MATTLERRAAYSQRNAARYHNKKEQGITPTPAAPKSAPVPQPVRAVTNDYDPGLLKPVRFVAPPAGMPAAERARLESERACLFRELDTVQRGIDHITAQLAA